MVENIVIMEEREENWKGGGQGAGARGSSGGPRALFWLLLDLFFYQKQCLLDH